jgi:cell pole-organizing protein PopZ
MSEPNQEPTMEEILASIRRIISEDEAPAGEEAAPAPMPEIEEEPSGAPEMHAPAPALEEFEAGEDVLELTERVEVPELTESHGDLDVYAAPEPEPEPAPPRMVEEEPIVSRPTAESAASAFGQLAQHVVMPREGRLLEDVVKELLRPLLKAWLDEHLPAIVQAKVEAEVERIARMRR